MTRIHSVAGLLPSGRGVVAAPPFRAPHHTASAPAIIGGGSPPKPGEVTLAHHGVLLLDELAEFARPALEALRQPLEDGTVAIARTTGRLLFPARFVLVGTMNLCPCGARGDPGLECACSPQRLSAYREKVSRALIDRFDLVLSMPRARSQEYEGRGEPSKRRSGARGRSSGEACVIAAATVRAGRRPPRPGGRHPAALRAREIARHPCGPNGGRARRSSRRRGRAPGRGAGLPHTFGAGIDRVNFPVLKRRDSEFPRLLRELHDPPPQLYLRGGSAQVLHEPAVAIVGARSCSSYGAQVARMVARELGAAGVVVVSGLARGIDGEAHRGALEAGGKTVAVLGCGIDRDYPRRHSELARRIEASGAIVSEYPPGTEPAPWRFPGSEPNRRRPLPGDGRRRGAISLRRPHHGRLRARARSRGLRGPWRDHGRPLGRNERSACARVPPLSSRLGTFSTCSGSSLAAKGRAALSTAAEDVLRLLSDEAREADGLTRASGRTSAEVGAALVELELAGLVASADGLYRAVVAV